MRRTLAIFAGLCCLMAGTVAATPAFASAGTVCGLDSGGVYRWERSGTLWLKIGGPARSLYGGGFGLFATTPDGGQIVRYLGGGNWQSIGGPGQTWAVTNDAIYGWSPDGSGIWKWTGSPWWWTQVGGSAGGLYGGGFGVFAPIPDRSGISRYIGPFWWQFLGRPDPQPSITYAVTGDAIYNLHQSGRLTKWRPDATPTGSWDLVDQDVYRYQFVYGGGFGLFGIDAAGALVRITGSHLTIASPGSAPFTISAIRVAVTDTDLYVTSSEGTWRWTRVGQNWQKISVGLQQIVPCPVGP